MSEGDATNGAAPKKAIFEAEPGHGKSLTVPAINGKHTQFTKGNTHGKGRPKGSIELPNALRQALMRVEKAKRKPFLDHVVERAYQNDQVIPHILDRVEPKPKDLETGVAITVNIVNYVTAEDAAQVARG